VHSTAPLLDGALDLALRAERTVHDALYVALAVAIERPLVTADRRLFDVLADSVLSRHVLWVEDVPDAES
jgi:predicted nucleic acid-binding protein